jgi:pimeloyl-ACP methyl ester carboxylesterase
LPGRGDNGSALRIAYRDWGGAGIPLVLLHGLSSNSRIWDLTAPLLLERFRVIAMDQRGHGLSDKPESYSSDEVTGDFVGLVDHLGFERPAVVGHSWGASVAVQFAAVHPKRASAIGLVDGGIIEISSQMSWEEAEKQMRPPEIDGVPLDRFLGFMRQWPDMADLWNEQLQEMVLSNLEVREGLVYRRLTIPNHMKILRSMYELKTSEMLSAIECPALVIIASQEPTNDVGRRWLELRKQGAKLAEQKLAKGRVLWMENTIHDVPIQRPRELAEAILSLAES